MLMEYTQNTISAKASEVSKLLQRYGVPVEKFGTGEAKTLDHLANEILEGETDLVEKDGKIVRRVVSVLVDVRYVTPEGVELQLLEEKQVFSDGRVRRRKIKGVGEKMTPRNEGISVAKKALKDEIGVGDSDIQIEFVETEETTMTSPSYPGLETEYIRHMMKTTISEADFRPEGYQEVQHDKTTYFVWVPVDPNNGSEHRAE
jgi:hypothetical protein